MKSKRLPTDDPETKPPSKRESDWNDKIGTPPPQEDGQEQQQEDGQEQEEDTSMWVEKYSSSHKRKYWKNTQTGKSTWTNPVKQPAKKTLNKNQTSSNNSTPSPSVSSPPPPPPSFIDSKMSMESMKLESSNDENIPIPSAKGMKSNRFSGGVPLQFGLWGHYMSLGCSLLCFWFGIVAIIWDKYGYFYGCKIDGTWIHDDYILKGEEFGVLVVSLMLLLMYYIVLS